MALGEQQGVRVHGSLPPTGGFGRFVHAYMLHVALWLVAWRRAKFLGLTNSALQVCQAGCLEQSSCRGKSAFRRAGGPPSGTDAGGGGAMVCRAVLCLCTHASPLCTLGHDNLCCARVSRRLFCNHTAKSAAVDRPFLP